MITDLMISKEPLITIEVVYAEPGRQLLIPMTVPEGTTAWQVVNDSGIADQVEGLDLEAVTMGVYSRVLDGKASPLPREYHMRDHDRLEIYRPLQLDPKEARLLRAVRARQRASRKAVQSD